MKSTIFKIFIVMISLTLLNCSNDKKSNQSDEELNVGFLFVGPIGDGGWNYAHNQGRIEIEDLPYINNVFYRENASAKETSVLAIEELIEEGANLIFATSLNHKEATLEMAEKYPEVIFESCSTFLEDENIGSYFGKIYQAWYLAGLVAGLQTETNKIGVVVAQAIPECRRITNAFALGVKRTNPQAKLYMEWIHSWYNPARENVISNKMIDMGCDVIAHNTDSNESQRVADSRNIYSIGYNTDMKDFAPKKNLISVVWNWGIFYKDTVEKVHKGEWIPKSVWFEIDSGIFGLTELSPHITVKDQEFIKEVKQDISRSDLVVFSGEIKDNKGKIRVSSGQSLTDEELLTIDWLVDNIIVLNPIATNED